MSFGDFLWSLLIFYFIFFYFMILFRIIGDLFSNHDASGWTKFLWILFLLFFPFIAICAYLISQGQGMTQRAMARAAEVNASQQAYIREVASTGTDPTDQIAKGAELLKSGAITQAEFDALKAKALA